MLKRVEELEAGVQRRIDEGFSHGVQTMVESQERSERVWEERTKWDRYQHDAEMEEVKREVGDLREKLGNKTGYKGHNKTDYGRTKYIPNKMDERYSHRNNNNNNNNRYNNNRNNNNNNDSHHKNRPAPRRHHQPAVQGRKVRSDIRPVMGSVVTSSTGRTSHSPVRAPCTVVALSCSPDPSKTDFRVRERGAPKIMETIEGKE
jgi:hypothetical protein